MTLTTHISIALKSLASTRVRTALTTLGIVIGVMAITLVLAIGEGAKDAVSKHVDALDDNILLVRPGATERQPNGLIDYNPLSSYATTTLTEHDLLTAEKLDNVDKVAPLMLVNGSIRFEQQQTRNAPIIATSPELAEILEFEAAEGQFLDGTTSRDTVVIGKQLSIELYGTERSIGRQLDIRGTDFTVIGVLDDVDNPLGVNGVNLDRAAIVSLDAGKAFNQGIAHIQQISVKPTDAAEVDDVSEKLHKVLLANHDDEEDFSVLRGDEAASIAEDFFGTIVIVTAAVAAISLLVGGIGIMNIMLVSVAERTREIGIRKSLGASNGQIMLQFLIESLVMSIIGGIVGFAAAYALAFAASTQLAFQPAITWYIVGVAFVLSIGVGTIFGLFPAIRAARKDPIDALRQYQ